MACVVIQDYFPFKYLCRFNFRAGVWLHIYSSYVCLVLLLTYNIKVIFCYIKKIKSDSLYITGLMCGQCGVDQRQ